MSDGVTCAKCLGRISAEDIDFKRRTCERLGKPYTTPRVCFECVLGVLLDVPIVDEKEVGTP